MGTVNEADGVWRTIRPRWVEHLVRWAHQNQPSGVFICNNGSTDNMTKIEARIGFRSDMFYITTINERFIKKINS